MNERLVADPVPARELNPEIPPAVEEVLFRALARNPRHRYSTASDMAWELEHQELVGMESGYNGPVRLGRFALSSRKLAIYAALAFVPLALFVVMLLMARR
jgi:serine/threonine protein kinase